MSIPLNALYIINGIEDTGMMIAVLIVVCGTAILLCLAIFAFGMVCKVFC